jgi:NAD(P)-dependent dehydrogenase (short-subunit alcohol dehydrogenase family)
MNLRSKRIVIVGGTSGIGFAIAEAALNDGAAVVVVSSNAANVDGAVKRLSGDVCGITMNATDEKAVRATFSRLGPFDHLVFTAGDWSMANRVSVAELDLEGARDSFSVRFWGALNVAKYAKENINPGGSITLTNGLIAHRPRKDSALRTAMAGSIEHLTRGLAVDFAPIRVNAVCPGLIRTGVWDSLLPSDGREEQFQRMTRHQPLARIGEPQEVAEAYLYLMRGGYTTGQVLHVDGGGSIV